MYSRGGVVMGEAKTVMKMREQAGPREQELELGGESDTRWWV